MRPCTKASSTEAVERDWPDGFNEVSAAQVCGEHLLGAGEDHLLECTDTDRNRIFNLGYYTWVEQQGVSLEEFEARRDQSFWRSLLDIVPVWDELIAELNARSGAAPPDKLTDRAREHLLGVLTEARRATTVADRARAETHRVCDLRDLALPRGVADTHDRVEAEPFRKGEGLADVVH